MDLYWGFWLIGVTCGFTCGNMFACTLCSYETSEGEVIVSGDIITLFLLIAYLGLRFFLNILACTDPITCSTDWFCGMRGLLLGSFTGFFLGRVFGLRQKYQKPAR